MDNNSNTPEENNSENVTAWMELGDLGYKYVSIDDDELDKPAAIKRAVSRALTEGYTTEEIVTKILMGAETFVDENS